MPLKERKQNSGLVIIALALAGVLYLGQIFHARWGELFLAKRGYEAPESVSESERERVAKLEQELNELKAKVQTVQTVQTVPPTTAPAVNQAPAAQTQATPTPAAADAQVGGQTAVPQTSAQRDVYVVTESYDRTTRKYWKNGVETQPFNIDGFECGSYFHIRGDIYRAGTEKLSNGNNIAIIKKNDYTLYHLSDGKFNANAKSVANAESVFVSGDNVYSAGFELNQQLKLVAIVWKNDRVLYRLADGKFYSLYVSGGDVYAAGAEYNNSQGKMVATVWKNGSLLGRLTDGSFNAGAYSLYLSGGDVYAGGVELNRQDKQVATVWKNGSRLYRLTDGSFDAGAYSLYVSGGDVYAAGYERNQQGKSVATVWKNDKVLYCLGDGDACLIFVR